MGNYFSFGSIGRGNVGYEFNSDSLSHTSDQYYRNHASYLGRGFLEYETYGDGNVKHNYSHPVGKEHWIDFFTSLALHLENNRGDVEILYQSYYWPRKAEREDIIFASTVIYKEDKPVWFNTNERKVSRSESKKHDKRWEEIVSWMDGSPHSISCILAKEYSGALGIFLLLEQIRWTLDSWVNWEKELELDITYEHKLPIELIEDLLNVFAINRNIESRANNLRNRLLKEDKAA
jgi:hypothetical protein